MKTNNQSFKDINEAIAAIKELRSESTAIANRLTVSFIKQLKQSELERLLKVAPRRWRTWIKYSHQHGNPSDQRSGRSFYNEALAARKGAAKGKPSAKMSDDAKATPIDGNANAAAPSDDAKATPVDGNANDAKATDANDAKATSTPRDLIAEISTLDSEKSTQELVTSLMAIIYADNVNRIMEKLPMPALKKLSSAISNEIHRRAEARRSELKARRAESAKKAKDKQSDATPTE